MNRILLLCLSLFLLAGAQLQAAPPANATFTSERGVAFNLRFDGRTLTRGGARQIHLDRIAPGMHSAEFLIPLANGRAITYRTRVFLDPGHETRFVLLTHSGRAPELRKVAAVPLRSVYGPRYGTNAPGSYYGNQQEPPVFDPHSDDNGNGTRPPVYQPGDYSASGGGRYTEDGAGYRPVMTPPDVDALRAAVERHSFDKDKLLLLQQALEEVTIPADDLALLLKELSFDSSKLELAKFGASRVADRQNLYRLNETFTFSATAREFQEYLAQQPR